MSSKHTAMTYELAKELKDAGFPQIGVGMLYLHGNVEQDEPTLAELIEACGDKFTYLHKDRDYWIATGHLDEITGQANTASTPEEAVAKLWLALNKK